ncbi:hypothetical protein SSS_04178 [Sarcoptes scabiei]|nr:hypothetical protein SSS_04178 [Sarcoptes scabiei]
MKRVEHWFRLCSNILFVYQSKSIEINPPIYAFVMENFMLTTSEQMPNAFSFYFLNEPDIKHSCFAMNSRQTKEWIDVLNQISYRKQRIRLNTLRLTLKDLTGIDPLQSTPWFDKH